MLPAMAAATPANRDARPTGSPPPSFVFQLVSTAGTSDELVLPVEAEGVANALGAGGGWKAVLNATLQDSAVVMREVALDPHAAARNACRGAPLATWHPEAGWIALLEGNAKRTKVVRGDAIASWVPATQILDWLGEEPLEWFAIESGLAGATARAGQRLGPFQRLLEIIRPERQDVLAVVLYSAFIGLLTLAIPVAVQQLVNTVAFGGLVQPVIVLAFLLFLGLSIAASMSAFQAYLAEVLQQRVFVRACADLASRLPRVDASAFGSRSAPAFVNRFFDLVTLQKTGARLLLEGSAVLLQTATGLLILSFYHPLMLGLSVVLVASMAAVTLGFGRSATASAIRESSAKYDLAEWLEELVRHRTAFRSTAGRARASYRADALIAAWIGSRRRHYRTVLRQYSAALAMQAVVNTLLLALGGVLVVAGELTLGQLVASEIIVAAVVISFARLAKQFESYYDLLAAVDKIGGLLDLPLERADAGAVAPENGSPASLSASNLRVTLGSRTVLNGASLALAPGEKVALLGSAGSGKSALLDSLAGIRQPDAGYVALGGEDLRDLAPEAARDGIMLVREPQILPATITDNLTLACGGATMADARRALEQVGLIDEVRRFEDGMDTLLAADGAPLSRSQAARLEIARAVIAKPRVLLLDDAMLHVDDESIKPVMDLLFAPDAPWTLVVVSRGHRFLFPCDRAVRIVDGRIEEALMGHEPHAEEQTE